MSRVTAARRQAAVWAALLLLPMPQSQPALRLEPCNPPDLAVAARCGTYEVWENRATRSGRRIRLRIVELPALDPDPAADPIVILEGGPGASNVAAARRFLASPLRQRRRILLIDTRGTGGSGPLLCGFQGFLDDFLPVAKVRSCVDSLRRTADLTQYITPHVVDDLDEVRRALGISQVNLWGSSGGTRQALVWIRRHPESVRTALLEGPVPVDARIPLTFAQDAQAALDGVLDDCAASRECAQRFPNTRSELAGILNRLDRETIPVRGNDPLTGAERELSVTRSAFAQVIRYMLYSPAGARAVPLVIQSTAKGDFQPFATRALGIRIGAGIATGFYLSNTCAEDLPFFTDAEGEARSWGTFLGNYRIRQQRNACAVWPGARLPEGYLAPVRSGIPVLILVGQRDPVTPPRWGHEILRTLERGRVLEIPGGGHSFGDLENANCIEELRLGFLETAEIPPAAPPCLATVRRRPFLVPPTG